MVKKYITTIFIGFIFWIVINAFLYPIIVNLVINKGYPVFINHIYFFFVYIMIGLFVGWQGSSKGWIWSLSFGIIITVFFVLISIFSNFLEVELNYFGYFGTLTRIFLAQLLFILYLTAGGFFGGHIRSRLGENNVKK
jgi:hypothetical protein